MYRAVKTMQSVLVHRIHGDDSKTFCGVFPSRKAELVIERKLMCGICFGKDRGAKEWTAAKLGIERIVE